MSIGCGDEARIGCVKRKALIKTQPINDRRNEQRNRYTKHVNERFVDKNGSKDRDS